MLFLENPMDASGWCEQRRGEGFSIGYVPTMGALHDGHLALVRQSIADNDLTCVSIFVNPLQFNHASDLEKYPRDMAADLQILREIEVAMVYTGSLAGFFPDKAAPSNLEIDKPCRAIAGLEADFRPGHLEGVQAIVERLFATVGDCRAYFGEKDFQQTLVVRELAERHGGVEVVVCPTVREPSGLAMSSRNARLSPSASAKAAEIYQSLLTVKRAWDDGERSPAVLESILDRSLTGPGIEIEYATVRDPAKWTAVLPRRLDNVARALVAATVDEVRLIDNLELK